MTELRRSISLPLLLLYGLGVTIGAGIYVLLGATADRAGIHAPMAFVVAAFVMAFSAASFAEFSSRFAVSAGEAAYVMAGFQSRKLSLLVGGLVILSGVVSSATITVGSTGYIQEFVDVDQTILVCLIILSIGALASWGIMESVIVASIFTVIETGALVVVIAAGIANNPDVLTQSVRVLPDITDIAVLAAISSASLLAFFAFIGFEDIVNLAEEVKNPTRTMPWAIFLTLLLSTMIYFLVSTISVLLVPIDDLAQSRAPVSLLFSHTTGASPVVITAIAIVATLNGVIIQTIMASRVIYGLARQGSFPGFFAQVHPLTQTPVLATVAVAGSVLVLALIFPLESLAEWTSRIALLIFTLVNAALVLLKRREGSADIPGFTVGIWVPVLGFLSCLGLLVSDLVF